LNSKEKTRVALLQGTLDLLILRILIFGPEHGQGIALAIQRNTDDVLLVDHGALYPALQRLEAQKWISAEWGVSVNNRRARFYTLTAKGRAHLAEESSRWRTLAQAMARILDLETLVTTPATTGVTARVSTRAKEI
jgi:PadR family transcriptional regulator PadR